MEGKILMRWRDRFILGALLVFSITGPSFSQTPPAAEVFSIQRIEVTEAGGASRVAVEGSQSFEYTVFRLSDPLRVVIDLPRAQLGKLAGPLEVRDGTINVIQNRQVDEPQKKGARIEIGLDQLVEYDVISEGNFLYLNFGKPPVPLLKEAKGAEKNPSPTAEPEKKAAEKKDVPAAKPLKKARLVKGVEIAAKPEWVKVGVQGDGLIPDYKSFQLSRPSRLVVDLPQMGNGSGKKKIDVGSPLLNNIRIGQHGDKVRLVFTFPQAKVPAYLLTREGQELRLVLGEAGKEPAKEDAPPSAAAPKFQPVEAEVKGPETGKGEAVPTVAVRPAMLEEKAPVREGGAAESPKFSGGMYRGARISLDFKDADIHNIFRLIAEVSSLNIITSEDVKGKVTIRMVNVPWDQALEVILSTKNLIRIEEGNVLRITTIETLRKEREDRQKEEEILVKTRDTKLKLEEPGVKIIKLSYGDAADLQKLLMEKEKEGRGFLSPQGSVKADKRTNTLIIQDVRSNLEEVEQLVKELDTPTPQVLIEARVVQAVTTFARAIGVQWGGSFNQTGTTAWGLTGNNPTAAAGWGFTPNQAGGGSSTNLIMPSNFVVNFPANTSNTPSGGLGVSFGKLTGNLINLDLRLQMGETDGQTRVIARPKLATLDNKEAHIKQGEKIPYETTSQAGTQVQFIDAVLQLKVTPHVTPEGSILMKVLVTRDARGSFRSPVNQVPSIENREAATEVLVKDGETLVIGGIYETESSETYQGIPWLMKVPVLGWLFKNQETSLAKRELLIFITPSIIAKKAEI